MQLQIADCRLRLAHLEGIGSTAKPEWVSWKCTRLVLGSL
jgi:hypothetical protein